MAGKYPLPLFLILLVIGAAAPSATLAKRHLYHHSPWIPHRRPAGEKLIFVLAGQSSMAGRGGVSANQWDGIVPPEKRPSRELWAAVRPIQGKRAAIRSGYGGRTYARSSSQADMTAGLLPV